MPRRSNKHKRRRFKTTAPAGDDGATAAPNEALGRWEGAIRPSPAQTDPSAIYEVAVILNKGLGVVSRRLIKKGTRIMSEQPLVQVTIGSAAEADDRVREAVSAVDKHKRDIFHTLHNRYPTEGADAKEPLTGIFITNALPCGPGSPVGAVYRTVCRINHDCKPNATAHWNEEARHETVHAIRDIQQEVTIAYIHHKTSKERPAALGFACKCDLCASPPHVLEASDVRRAKIQEFNRYLDNAALAAIIPPQHLVTARILLSTLAEEYGDAVGTELANVYDTASQVAVYMEDHARAHAFAQRAYNATVLFEGAESPSARRAAMLVEAGRLHSKFFGGASAATRPPESNVAAFDRWLWEP